MGGGGTDTRTEVQTSGLSNPAMQAAATTIGNQLNTQLGKGVTANTNSLVPGMSSQTQAGLAGLGSNPNDATFASGVSTALGQQADIAGGNIANDLVRQNVADDAGVAANATFANSGRFGSGTHREGLGTGIANALAAHDYGRQQQAISNMGTLYSASQQPAMGQLQAGSSMDAYNSALAQDQARIFDETNNAGWNTLQRGSSIFSGTAPVSGTTSTNATSQPSVPWWQQVGGYVLGNAGKAVGMM